MWWYYLVGTIGFTGAGLYIFCSQLITLRRFLKFGVRTMARKVSLVKIKDGDDDIELPVVEFQDQHGVTIRATMQWNLYNKKEFIRIIYDPADPKQIIPDYWTKYINLIFAIVFLAFAVPMIQGLANDNFN